MSYEQYWDSYPNEVNAYISAYIKKQKIQLKDTDFTNWLLGNYISTAFNNPKKYPREQKLSKIMRDEETKEERLARVMKSFGL